MKALADTNGDGTVSDTETLLLTFSLVDALSKPFSEVHQYDITGDSHVDSFDINIFLNELDTLDPQ